MHSDRFETEPSYSRKSRVNGFGRKMLKKTLIYDGDDVANDDGLFNYIKKHHMMRSSLGIKRLEELSSAFETIYNKEVFKRIVIVSSDYNF
jgi:hypothetical protein